MCKFYKLMNSLFFNFGKLIFSFSILIFIMAILSFFILPIFSLDRSNYPDFDIVIICSIYWVICLYLGFNIINTYNNNFLE